MTHVCTALRDGRDPRIAGLRTTGRCPITRAKTLGERWFGAVGPPPPDQCALFCLPYAGGSATAFWDWQRLLPSPVRVELVQLPGRDGRSDEPLAVSPVDIAEAIARHATGPYALYGHSMGARVAFEVTRELRRAGAPPPIALYLGGARPPHLAEPLAGLAGIGEHDLIDQMITRLNAPAELRSEPEIRALLMPVIRADLHWLKRYRFVPEAPLGTPVVAFAGTMDREVPAQLMLGWARHTTAGFRLHTLRGDHLLIRAEGTPVPGLIAQDLAARMAAADPPLGPPEPDEVHVWMSREARPDAALRRLRRRYAGTEPVFGLDHRDSVVVIAVTREARAGVAVRRVRPIQDADALYAGLGPAEQAEVAAAPEESRPLTALKLLVARQAGGDGSRPVTVLELPGAVAAIAAEPAGQRLRFEILPEVAQ